MYSKNRAPHNEIIPKIILKDDNFDIMKKVKSTIGRSVTTGAKATLIPALILCWMVSEITRVRSGPGAIPAESPNMIPAIRNSVIFHFFLFLCI